MSSQKLFLCLLLCVLSAAVQARVLPTRQDGEDYYWTEYTGEIPEDALPGGTDKKGRTTYIGQTNYGASVVPGEIDAQSETLFYTMNRRQQTTKTNIKILCAHTPEWYEWIDTNISSVRFLRHKHLIQGGHYSQFPFLIGRTHQEGIVTVGKIYVGPGDDWFAYIIDGKAHYVKSDFQILTFNPQRSVELLTIGNSTGCGNKVYFTFELTLTYIYCAYYAFKYI